MSIGSAPTPNGAIRAGGRSQLACLRLTSASPICTSTTRTCLRMQRQVLELALQVLAGATAPGTRVDLDVEWPVPIREAYRAWQPKEASPIVKVLLETGRRPE